MEQTDSDQRRGERGISEEGEGTRQRTCMNDLWTWATERGLTMGVGGGLGRGEQRGENLSLIHI